MYDQQELEKLRTLLSRGEIKAIAFDFDDTIWPLMPGWQRSLWVLPLLEWYLFGSAWTVMLLPGLLPYYWPLREHMQAVKKELGYIASQYPVAICSNTITPRLHWILWAMGLAALFPVNLRLGRNLVKRWRGKPHSALFDLLCERLELQPNQILFLDNTSRNIQAAGRLGFYTLLVDDDRASKAWKKASARAPDFVAALRLLHQASTS